MLEKMFDYTPEELGHILSLETMELLKNDAFSEDQQEQAIEAAFVLVALDLSNDPLSEEEMADAVDKVKLYVQTNDMREN